MQRDPTGTWTARTSPIDTLLRCLEIFPILQTVTHYTLCLCCTHLLVSYVALEPDCIQIPLHVRNRYKQKRDHRLGCRQPRKHRTVGTQLSSPFNVSASALPDRCTPGYVFFGHVVENGTLMRTGRRFLLEGEKLSESWTDSAHVHCLRLSPICHSSVGYTRRRRQVYWKLRPCNRY